MCVCVGEGGGGIPRPDRFARLRSADAFLVSRNITSKGEGRYLKYIYFGFVKLN